MTDEKQMDEKSALMKTDRKPLAFMLSNWDEAWRAASQLAKSGLMPDALKNKPDDVLVVLLTGAELGLSPMQSIREVYVVKGKGYISSLLKVALVKQSAWCITWKVEETNAKICTIATQRRGDDKVTRLSFTIEMAQRAGLLGGGESSNWNKYTEVMLRRRCASMLADEVYPDVVRGVGSEEEMVDVLGSKAPEVKAPPPPVETLKRVDAPEAKPSTQPEDARLDVTVFDELAMAIGSVTSPEALRAAGNRVKDERASNHINDAQRDELLKLYTAKQSDLRKGP